MWVLECDGELLDNKRVWLRPGKSHLFGRTKADPAADPAEQLTHVIVHKSVSRKHLLVTVEQPNPGDGALVHKRSRLTVTDCSKIGTTIDGVKITNESSVLEKAEHKIKLGNFGQTFRIKWEPVVLTFTYTAKELKDGRDPLRNIHAKLEPLDMKSILTYVHDQTTHVVASKRNTAKGLQALINGKYIVTEAYVDALAQAATPTAGEVNAENPSSSPLEVDFDRNFPDPLAYLPDAGREPHPRPAEVFKPDSERANIFAGYVFVFCDDGQYNNLADVVNSGAGKAVKFDMEPGRTRQEELMQFVRNLQGKKHPTAENGDEGKGVVLVDFKVKQELDDWAMEYRFKIGREFKRAWLEQNEFLDAILMTDTSVFRRPFNEADFVGDTPMSTAVKESAQPPKAASSQAAMENEKVTSTRQTRSARRQASPAPAEEPRVQAGLSEGEDGADGESHPAAPLPTPARRRGRRAITTSRFKGFDNFDPSQLPKTQSIPEAGESSEVSQRMESDSQSLFVGPSQRPWTQLPTQQGQESLSRKRRTPPLSPSPDADDMVEGLLPAAAAMKRRRLEEERTGNRTFTKPIEEAKSEEPKDIETRKKTAKKKVDYLGIAREHREAEDEAARKDQESMMQAMEETDIEQMKNLAIVETFELPERTDRPRRLRDDGTPLDADAERGADRWDPKWNGRKNFKRFRRQGMVQTPNRGPRVIVGLEEVKKKGFGIGEDYWLDSSDKSKRRKERQAGAHSQSQQLPRGTEASTATIVIDADEDEEDVVLPEEISGRPRDDGLAARAEENRRTEKAKMNSQAQSQGRLSAKAAGKRPATDEVPLDARPPLSKRQQVEPTSSRPSRRRQESSEDEESDDDGLKFRLRKRK